MDSVPVKRCTKCGVEKPLTADFFPTRDGGRLRGHCRECEKRRQADKQKRWRQAHPEEQKRRRKAAYDANPETARSLAREWRANNLERAKANRKRNYAENAERDKALVRTWRQENSDRVKAQKARYNAKHPEKVLAWKRAYALRNPEKEKARHHRYYRANRYKISVYHQQRYLAQKPRILSLSRLWKSRNPDKVKAAASRRRALIKQAQGTHTADDIQCKLASQAQRCYWCGNSLPNSWHVDHIFALSKGGSNGPENICIACPTCNLQKNAKEPFEFIGRLF